MDEGKTATTDQGVKYVEMNQMDLGIVIQDSKVVVSSRDVARVFEKDHRHILRDIAELQCSSAFRESNFGLSSYRSEQNKEMPEYLITRDGFTLLAMGYTGEKAMHFKEMYIRAFNLMEESIRNQSAVQIPTSLVDALRLAADIEERRLALLAENHELRPKADFYDAVAGSTSAIEMSLVAKTLNFIGVGRNTLFKVLRQKRILMQDNQPYQEYVDRGYFRTIEQKYMTPEGETCISVKTVVFQRGVEFVRKVLLSMGFRPQEA